MAALLPDSATMSFRRVRSWWLLAARAWRIEAWNDGKDERRPRPNHASASCAAGWSWVWVMMSAIGRAGFLEEPAPESETWDDCDAVTLVEVVEGLKIELRRDSRVERAWVLLFSGFATLSRFEADAIVRRSSMTSLPIAVFVAVSVVWWKRWNTLATRLCSVICGDPPSTV